MAMTHDYPDQLDQNAGIAPANSQEEYQAAQTIADIMRRHGVEPSIEEFDAKAFGGVMDQILFAMLFVGMLLVGFVYSKSNEDSFEFAAYAAGGTIDIAPPDAFLVLAEKAGMHRESCRELNVQKTAAGGGTEIRIMERIDGK